MATWPPDSMLGKLFLILARYSPPGSQVELPVSWGDETILKKRLSPFVQHLRIKREVVRFRSPSAGHWVEFMKTYFGPAILAFQHSSPEAQHALTEEMTELMREHNRASNGTALGESEYLDIVGIRR